MKSKRWIRALALCLCLVMLAGVASAATYTLDLSGDGKVNVWDIQVAINQSKPAAHQEAILDSILGGGDELHPNADGVYEVWTPLGLYNMVKLAKKGETFKLMTNIDMGGVDWTPIENFVGILDGNNKTISNFTITEAVAGSDGASMGFFALVNRDSKNVQSIVKNLNLKDVTIVVPTEPEADVCYIGLIAGSNRGKITNCTTDGYVIDQRTTLTAPAYVGTIVGRNNDSTPPGEVRTGANLLTVTAGTPNAEDKVTGVTSKMGMDFAELSYPEGTAADKQYKRNIGIAGYSKTANIDTDMIWQDNSNDFSRLSEAEQERRQAAVDNMYKQGTMKWTTSELLTYTVNGSKTHIHSNIFIPGTTYTGIPYNSVGGGYDRAMGIMQEKKDSQGRFVTVKGLENGVKDADGKSSGFVLMMGSDCSAAVGWAWAAASPARLANDGVRVSTTPYMIPNEYNTANYGVLPAGGYKTLTSNTEKYTQGVDARDTAAIIALNGGAEGMAGYYAKANRGDALLCVRYELDTETDTWVKGTGHARLLAADPVVIRNYKGVVDLQKSYVITHEQGDGLFGNRNANGKYDTYNGYNVKYTSWRTNFKYTLANLLTQEGHAADEKAGLISCGWGFVPVTIPAFAYEGELRAPYLNDGYTSETAYHPVVLPNSGWNYSNWMIASATMTITDVNGNTVYNKTGYPAGRTTATETLKLEAVFPDATDNLTAGQTYRITVAVLATNGDTIYADYRNHLAGGKEIHKLNNFEFVYTPVN